jgi:hypothetical protein
MAFLTPAQCLEMLSTGQHLPEPTIRALCDVVRTMLSEEPNIALVASPVVVAGDIHGVHDLAFDTSCLLIACPRSNSTISST